MSLIEQVNKYTEEGGAYSVIAQYLVDHMNDLAELDIHDIASDTFTSYSTISRFFKRLDCKGITDFKIKVASEKRKQQFGDQPYEIVDDKYDSVLSAANDMYCMVDFAVKQARTYLPAKEIECCCDILAHSAYTGFYVLEKQYKSFIFKYKQIMNDIGINVIAPDNDDYVSSTRLFTPDDSVIIVADSISLRQNDLFLRELKKRNVAIILITNISVWDQSDEKMCEIILPDLFGVSSIGRKFMTGSAISYYLDVIMLYTGVKRKEKTL